MTLFFQIVIPQSIPPMCSSNEPVRSRFLIGKCLFQPVSVSPFTLIGRQWNNLNSLYPDPTCPDSTVNKISSGRIQPAEPKFASVPVSRSSKGLEGASSKPLSCFSASSGPAGYFMGSGSTGRFLFRPFEIDLRHASIGWAGPRPENAFLNR